MVRINVPDGEGTERQRMWRLRPEMAEATARLAHAVYDQSILEPRVREAARMRIAQINDCPI
jgi:alkylhydroperoxidase family enzyme